MPPRKRKRQADKLRGSRRMREFGYTLVTVWLDALEAELIKSAAYRHGQRVATFVRRAAVDLASAPFYKAQDLRLPVTADPES